MQPPRITEVELDHAFAEALQTSEAMQSWLLGGGRFARFAGQARLLVDEQSASRKSAKHWWKHWWCKLPDGRESETDIFLVFEAEGQRFALHVEDKPAHGKLLLDQAVSYRRRAVFMANQARWMDYCDFETALIAPAGFIATHADCVAQFDRAMAYESIVPFAPLFASAS